MNPGISAWLTLAARAKLAPGENVLILGATGVTGKLATKIAKLLGAARVVAAGRNPEALSALLATALTQPFNSMHPPASSPMHSSAKPVHQAFRSSSITCGGNRRKHF